MFLLHLKMLSNWKAPLTVLCFTGSMFCWSTFILCTWSFLLQLICLWFDHLFRAFQEDRVCFSQTTRSLSVMYYDHVHDGVVVDRACSFTDLIVSVLDLEDLSVLIVILSCFLFTSLIQYWAFWLSSDHVDTDNDSLIGSSSII